MATTGDRARVVHAALDAVRNAGSETRALAGFARGALRIDRRRQRQTATDAAELARRYQAPVFPDVYVWDLVQMLGACVDPTDPRLLGASQLVHVAQVLDAMERAGDVDPDLALAAIVHDLGKVLLLTDADPATVVGSTRPIGPLTTGAGLDAVVWQWGHAEYAYRRLVDHLPGPVAWLVRYHGIEPQRSLVAMSPRDRDLTTRYLLPFRAFDRGSKSAIRAPMAVVERYRDLVEKRFPDPIAF